MVQYFPGWVGGVDKLRIKLSQLSTKVEVEVEAELGNSGKTSWAGSATLEI